MEENWNLDIDSYPKRLITCDGETLADKDLPPTKFIIKGLLPQGLALLSGSPKVGKSWLTLDLVVRIAKGEQIWNFPTDRGTTLYISLEDTESRLQERLLTITEEAPPDVHFATNCLTIGDGLEEQIRNFVTEHPHTVLVAIDIFQKVRSNSEVSYSVDYNEMEILKQLSQELKIAILLVHHVRKEKADDPFDMISGSNGLAGCADTEFVLLKSKRSSGYATLHCTGRDIEDREINLRFCKETCTWEYISDSVENPEMKSRNAVTDGTAIAENTGYMERPLGNAGGADSAANRSRRADGADTDGVSGDTSAAGGTDSDDDLNLDGNLPITGWESERELFTTTILGGTDEYSRQRPSNRRLYNAKKTAS